MRRVRAGELIAAAGAVALLVVTFLDWYVVDGVAVDAWGAFRITDLLLAVVIALGLGLLAVQLVGRGPALPVSIAVLTATIALAAALLVAYRILNQPGPNDLVEVRAGAWLGLFAAALEAFGAWHSLSDERPRPVDPRAPTPERRATPARS